MEPNHEVSSAKRLMAALVASIFISEAMIMLIIESLSLTSKWHEIFLDSTLLCMVTIPAVYYFAFLPMQRLLMIRKQAEENIRRINADLQITNDALVVSQERYAHLFDFAPVGYLILSDAGLIKNINVTGAKLLGVKGNEALEDNLEAFLPADERAMWRQCLQNILAADGKQSYKLLINHVDGSTFYALLTCQCERVLADTKIHISFTDITKENWARYEV